MSNKRMVPEVRFKGFEGDWKNCVLNDFGNFEGGTSLESYFCSIGKYKVISIGSYNENNHYNDQGIRVNENPKTLSKLLKQNDLAMILNDKTLDGKIIGSVLLIDNDNEFVYNQRTQKISPYTNLFNSQFLFTLLNNPTNRFKIFDKAQGNTQIYVNWTNIKDIDYFIPKIYQEQSKIGEFFKNIDNLIIQTTTKLDKLKDVKKSLLNKMFPIEGKMVPEIRFKGFEEIWENHTLGDFLKDPILQKVSINNESQVITLGLNLTGLRKGINRNVPKFGSTNYFSRYQNQFIYGKQNFFNGSIGIVPAEFNGLCTSNDVPAFDVVNMYPYYLFHYVARKEYYEPTESLSLGTGSKRLHPEILKGLEIKNPNSLYEQSKIAEFLTAVDKLITLTNTKLTKLKDIKKALLQKMFV
ncbi:restriction endonuclease subunit S [Mycoplasmopsis felifaucium]|uniref:Restriction endonuclease subunit S n=1 Tax=Mycoplasmopsis felifaucium TaxID=35768 RepID=A0ABZ2RQ92_9BACT